MPQAANSVIILDDQQFSIGEMARLFHSVVFGPAGKMHMLCRHEKIREPRDSHDPNIFHSKVEHLVYDYADGLKLQSKTIIDDGEECRLWQQPDGTPYALYMHTNTGMMEGYDFRIANLTTGAVQTVNFPGGMPFKKGKNWMPFAMNEKEIGFVHSGNPLRILTCDPATGATREVWAGAEYTTLQAQHDNYNIFRGSTNGLPCDGGWEGYGHTTSEPHIHLPYHWRLLKQPGGGFDFAMDFNLDLSALQDAGFSIIDPTSYFDDPDGNRWLTICGSERTWFWGQRILSLIWPVRITNPEGAFIRAMQPFMCAKADLAEAISIYPRNRTLGPVATAPGALGIILGQRSLFHILPQKLRGRRYHCDFYYCGYAPPEQTLAELSFFLCEDGAPTEMHMTLELVGTENAIQRVEIDMPIFPPDTEMMVTCQYNWNAPLEFFHMQLRQIDGQPLTTLYNYGG